MEFSQYDVNALMYVTNRPEIVFTEGSGMWMTDHNGKRYLDYLQGWAVNTLAQSFPCFLQRPGSRTGFAADQELGL